MSRKSIVICSIVAAILALAVAVGMLYLFAERGSAVFEKVRSEEALPSVFKAIPSDAVMVAEFGSVKEASTLFGKKTLPPALLSADNSVLAVVGKIAESADCAGAPMALSLHYSGYNKLSPLLVIDGSGKDVYDMVKDAAKAANRKLVCSWASPYIIISDSEVLLETSERHVRENISILDNADFSSMAQSVGAGANLFVNHVNLGKLFSGAVNSAYLKYAQFFQKYAYWSVLTLDAVDNDSMRISGMSVYNIPDDAYCHIYDKYAVRPVSVYPMVPHYASMVFVLPVPDVEDVVAAIDDNNDSRRNLGEVQKTRAALKKSLGIDPLVWADEVGVREAAVVRLAVAGGQEYVNLVKCSRKKIDTLLVASGVVAENYTPVVSPFAYKGVLASLFGDIFSWSPEEYASYISGWLVIGSENAVNDFVSGKALELNMERYLTDAGVRDVLPSKVMMNLLVNFSSDRDGIAKMFKKPVQSNVAANLPEEKVNIMSYSVQKGRNGLRHFIDFKRSGYEIPVMSRYEKDTVVVVPQGPWKVKNSGTGRTNLMYQQKNMYICLTEENGRGIWSAPFDSPICGNIGQVDYFENGKLQMLFASGKKLYLIDRLGRMVRPFPVSVGKEILLGPDVYDFNGNRKYNVMLLHKDNTLGLYDLQGRMRDDWKGFSTTETIKSLPELLEVNSALYWVVTTSMQTVICNFSGVPVADFSGNKALRPGVEIKPVAGDVVEVETYSGKIWKLNLKTGVFSK